MKLYGNGWKNQWIENNKKDDESFDQIKITSEGDKEKIKNEEEDSICENHSERKNNDNYNGTNSTMNKKGQEKHLRKNKRNSFTKRWGWNIKDSFLFFSENTKSKKRRYS